MTKTYYKISFPDNTCYVGTTKVHHFERWGNHLNSARRGRHENHLIQKVYDDYGCDEWVWEVLFKETGTKHQHKINEYQLINETPNTLNIQTGKYALASKQDLSDFVKINYHKNKEKIALKRKQERLEIGPEREHRKALARKHQRTYVAKNKLKTPT